MAMHRGPSGSSRTSRPNASDERGCDLEQDAANRDNEGLQVLPSQEKQTNYSRDLPEVVYGDDWGLGAQQQQQQQQWQHKCNNNAAAPARVCGLRRTVFWLVVLFVVLVIVGAVSGGVAGGLLTRDNDDGSSHLKGKNSTTSSLEAAGPSTATTTLTTTTSAPVTSGTSGLTKNPCPKINGTTLEAAHSDVIFAVLCSVDWPDGINTAKGDGQVSDISRTTTYTLQACIDACVGYRGGACHAVTYEANLTASFGGGQGGNCFFKDGAGEYFAAMDTTISAGIIGGP